MKIECIYRGKWVRVRERRVKWLGKMYWKSYCAGFNGEGEKFGALMDIGNPL